MKKKEYIFNARTYNKNLDFKKYQSTYNKYGVLVFRNFFYKDKLFDNYYNDLKTLSLLIAKKNKLKISRRLNLNQLITEISKTNRKNIGYLYDLGTRPMKLVSGTKLKNHPIILKILKCINKKKTLYAYPYLGETLHIFPPGRENFKYNLAIHQDYQFIMQSPDQVTVYINLGKLADSGNGGIRAWVGSHKEGVINVIKNKYGHYETKNSQHIKDKYECEDFHFDKGDLAIFNSLLLHEGIQNHSDCTRIVQLIRYSNLLNKESTSYYWQSTESKKQRKSIQFKNKN